MKHEQTKQTGSQTETQTSKQTNQRIKKINKNKQTNTIVYQERKICFVLAFYTNQYQLPFAYLFIQIKRKNDRDPIYLEFV